MSDMFDEGFRELQSRLHALYARPGFKIRRLRQISEALFVEACAEYSVTTTQFGVLYVLGQIDGIDQITVARLVRLDRSTAGLVIELLENRKMITRCVDATDKRRRLLHITPEGRALLARLELPASRVVGQLLDSLSRKDQKRLLSLIDRLLGQSNGTDELLAMEKQILPLLQRPGIMIRRLHQKSFATFLEEGGASGLTPTQFGILYVVRHCGPVDQITLARLIAVDRSTIALVVRLLTERGLLEKTVDPGDKRRRTLVLSQAGIEEHERSLVPAKRAMERWLEPLEQADRDWLMLAFDRLISRHEARFSTVPLGAL